MSVGLLRLPKKGLRVAHLNICSLRNKVTELATILLDNDVHVMAITETHLYEEILNSELAIQGYNIFRLDRDGNGGGVAFYIQEHIPVKIRRDLWIKGVEALWLQIQIPHLKPIIICCCYRPPRSDSKYLDNVCSMLQNATDTNYEVIFASDMNVDWSANCSLRKKLNEIASVCNLSQIVNVPTRITINNDGSRTSTCIDHFYTNAANKCSKVISLAVGFSDHNLIATTWKAKVPKNGPRIVHRRMYKTFSEEQFVNDLKNVDWNCVMNINNTEDALAAFTKIFLEVCDKHAPIKKITVRRIKTPWLDDELKTGIKERDSLKELAMITNCPETWQQYKALRNTITKMNRQKKKYYYQSKILECKNDSKKLWKTLKEVVGKESINKVPSFIEVEGVFITKPRDIANYFNNFFINKVESITSQMQPTSGISDSNLIIKNKIMNGKTCGFQFKKITVGEMEKLLLTIKSDKPCGTDNLDGRLLLIATRFIMEPLCHIFNLCVDTCVFPSMWKTAKVTPLPKNSGETFTGQNSRPVSILPVVSKLMEQNMCKQIQHYMEENNINSECQHAYRAGYSTNTALVSLTDNWLEHIDKGESVGAALLDFSAAFDVIHHGLLINKLILYNFRDNAVELMKSYLGDRKQCVQYNGTISDIVDLQCGLPQGSCLGPLLYSIFVNDLPYTLKNAHMEVYADDTTIWVAGGNEVSVNRLLQEDITLVSNWIRDNRLKLNVSKTKSIRLVSRNGVKPEPNLKLLAYGTDIEQVREVKLLGVIIDERLSFSSHINKIVSKMGRTISMVRRGAHLLSASAVQLVLQTLVLSCLDYCPVIWSSATKQDRKRLQVAQNRAARLALGCSNRKNVEWMNEALSWLTVDQRLAYSLTTFLFNVYRVGKLQKLLSQLQLTVDRHSHATRIASNEHFTLPLPRTNARKRTVMYRAASQWNKLPPNIIKISNKWRFKKTLKKAMIDKEIKIDLDG